MNPCPLQYERLTHYPSTSHGHTECVWPEGQPPSSQISAAGSHHERSSTQEGWCELWGDASAITYPTTLIFHVKGWEQLVKSRASSSVSRCKIPQVFCKCPGAAGPCLGAGCGGCTPGLLFHKGIGVSPSVQWEMRLCLPLCRNTHADHLCFAHYFAATELPKPHRVISLTAATDGGNYA